mgnify:CR=1 FL=1
MEFEESDGEIKKERIRIRKRIRVKKKPDPKKKIKKYLRIFAWIIVVAIFITTLIVLFSESDLRYENTKKPNSTVEIIPSTKDFSENNNL